MEVPLEPTPVPPPVASGLGNRPPELDTGPSVAVALGAEPGLLLGFDPAPVVVALDEAVGEPLLTPEGVSEGVTSATVDPEGADALQDRSYSGSLPKVEPMTPKLGEGVAGEAS